MVQDCSSVTIEFKDGSEPKRFDSAKKGRLAVVTLGETSVGVITARGTSEEKTLPFSLEDVDINCEPWN